MPRIIQNSDKKSTQVDSPTKSCKKDYADKQSKKSINCVDDPSDFKLPNEHL